MWLPLLLAALFGSNVLSAYAAGATKGQRAKQAAALHQASKDIKASSWTADTQLNWNGSDPCNNWVNVACNPEGNVVNLTLRGYFQMPPYVEGVETPTPEAPMPSSISRLTRLKHLVIRVPGVTGTLPLAYSALRNLRSIEVVGSFTASSLTGTLPAQYSKLTKLTSLTISANLLNGTLPAAYSALKKLKVLSLRDNRFNGSLPASWSSLKNLELLSFNQNNLRSSLPAAWSKLGSLTNLDVSSNTLTGTLPAAYSTLSKLQNLLVSMNRFRGRVPYVAWKAGMTSLKTLEVYTNRRLNVSDMPAGWPKNFFAFGGDYGDYQPMGPPSYYD